MLSGMSLLVSAYLNTLTNLENLVGLSQKIVSLLNLLYGTWLTILRKQAGYFLPLSGGIDSCATAVISKFYSETHSSLFN